MFGNGQSDAARCHATALAAEIELAVGQFGVVVALEVVEVDVVAVLVTAGLEVIVVATVVVRLTNSA